jgi:FOG: CheY-like receiver
MLKILIVDDSVFSQKVTANMVKKFLESVEISFSSDGEEGLQTYKEIKPDYVFVDLLMPKLDGQTLIPLIKEFDSEANIIVVSADVQRNVRDEVEAHHIMSFINKPFTEDKAQSICSMIKEKENDRR